MQQMQSATSRNRSGFQRLSLHRNKTDVGEQQQSCHCLLINYPSAMRTDHATACLRTPLQQKHCKKSHSDTLHKLRFQLFPKPNTTSPNATEVEYSEMKPEMDVLACPCVLQILIIYRKKHGGSNTNSKMMSPLVSKPVTVITAETG